MTTEETRTKHSLRPSTWIVALLLSVATGLLVLGLAPLASASTASRTYRVKSTQPVHTTPSGRGSVMGQVFANERVRLLCQAQDERTGRLYSFVEYHVDGRTGPNAYKAGFVDDAAVATGTIHRVAGVPFGDCPNPQTQPGPRIGTRQPHQQVQKRCWVTTATGLQENRAHMNLFDGMLKVEWCAEHPGGPVVSVQTLDGRTNLQNTTLVTDPAMDVYLTPGSELGVSTSVQVAIYWSAAKTWTADAAIHAGGGIKKGPIDVGGDVDVAMHLKPGRFVISNLLTLDSNGTSSIGRR